MTTLQKQTKTLLLSLATLATVFTAEQAKADRYYGYADCGWGESFEMPRQRGCHMTREHGDYGVRGMSRRCGREDFGGFEISRHSSRCDGDFGMSRHSGRCDGDFGMSRHSGRCDGDFGMSRHSGRHDGGFEMGRHSSRRDGGFKMDRHGSRHDGGAGRHNGRHAMGGRGRGRRCR